MAYILGQYNYKTSSDIGSFSNYETSGVAMRFKKDTSDDPLAASVMTFKDECLYSSTGFTLNNNYYFHGKIQRKSTKNQIFTIKLVLVEEDSTEAGCVKPQLNSKEQFIKTINIRSGNNNEFVDIEFIFSPLDNFNCILFELQRDIDDYRITTRYPKIIYEELSNIKNIVSGLIGLPTGTKFIKIGVQGRPGFTMCINNEEIKNSRSGIFEIKNGVMTVSFFSVVAAAEEDNGLMDEYIESLKNKPEDTEDQCSKCFFDTTQYPKTRIIDSFTLDYMYQSK